MVRRTVKPVKITFSDSFFYKKITNKYRKGNTRPFRFPLMVFLRNTGKVLSKIVNLEIIIRLYFSNQIITHFAKGVRGAKRIFSTTNNIIRFLKATGMPGKISGFHPVRNLPVNNMQSGTFIKSVFSIFKKPASNIPSPVYFQVNELQNMTEIGKSINTDFIQNIQEYYYLPGRNKPPIYSNLVLNYMVLGRYGTQVISKVPFGNVQCVIQQMQATTSYKSISKGQYQEENVIGYQFLYDTKSSIILSSSDLSQKNSALTNHFFNPAVNNISLLMGRPLSNNIQILIPQMWGINRYEQINAGQYVSPQKGSRYLIETGSPIIYSNGDFFRNAISQGCFALNIHAISNISSAANQVSHVNNLQKENMTGYRIVYKSPAIISHENPFLYEIALFNPVYTHAASIVSLPGGNQGFYGDNVKSAESQKQGISRNESSGFSIVKHRIREYPYIFQYSSPAILSHENSFMSNNMVNPVFYKHAVSSVPYPGENRLLSASQKEEAVKISSVEGGARHISRDYVKISEPQVSFKPVSSWQYLSAKKESIREYHYLLQHKSPAILSQAGTLSNHASDNKPYLKNNVHKFTFSAPADQKRNSFNVENQNFIFNKQGKIEQEVEEIKKIVVETKKVALEKPVPPRNTGEGKLDINRIANEVYQNIERRIRIEKERRGICW